MSKWITRGIFTVLFLAILGTAGSMMLSTSSTQDSGPKLTHTVSRGGMKVTVTEQGVLESSENTEIKCKVRGQNTVIWVIENGTQVKEGDVLVRLDTLEIEDAINERTKYAHWSQSGAEYSKAEVARATLAIDEYLEGRYVSELLTLEKDLAVAESNLRTAKNMLSHSKRMSERGYVSELDVEQKEFALTQAELNLKATKTRIEVLKTYTKQMELETLNGNLNSIKATHAANVERAVLDATRRDQALEEFEHCVVKAEKSGLVIYPSAAAWKNSPDIAEGATVHKDQVLMLMPNLSKMQVKVGVHESVVDRIEPGMDATVSLPDLEMDATVYSVASVAQPTGWWTGNIVKYDCIIQLPSIAGLKPGMSAEVEVVMADYQDVLTVPVSAVLETETETLCWVMVDGKPQRRVITLGDSNDVFIIVEEGLREGE
ncbi:efflux RND transporter periplasmic adaptor subunit, partial [Stieleria sp.]|uniref:efflux RND transporter periplasmic adaptor subunit n=1 Tax=Stieleria sp. TaxID=2795976 RepID=UPI003565C464